jgi:hypothetical protein
MVHRDKLVDLITAALMRATERQGGEEGGHFSWPDDLRARDIVRLLREHSPAAAAKATNEDVSR